MSIRKKIIGGFISVFVIGLILGIAGLYSARTLTAMSDEQYELQQTGSSISGVLNAHYVWRQGITEAVLTMGPFTGSPDPKTCALGVWRNSEEAKSFSDAEITSLLQKLDEPHNYIHNEVKTVVALIEAGAHDEAQRLLVEDILPKTEEAISLLTSMEKRCEVLIDEKGTEIIAFGSTVTTIIVAGIAASLLISLLLAYLIISSIMKPIRMMAVAAETISTGDLDVHVRYTVKDEIGKLASSFQKMIDATKQQIVVTEMLADGDLTVEVTPRSDKDAMNIALLKMIGKLNGIFSDIQLSTEQVSTGSKQIADGSQALAQGSTEQASAVDELSGAISEIARKTKANAEMAEQAAKLAATIKGNAEKGSRQMDEMMDAVKEINEASQSINKVIKVIDDIAFQTNILALNAAVEAARAGQHGKGFAVVAEEVRNLAAKSADAAKETGSMIANSMEKAELGSRIADETAVSLTEIVSGISESTLLVGEIAKSSEEQTIGITQINRGIEQVAQVVQQNSATAQQSAAASQEMNSQANMLEELTAQFTLRSDGSYPARRSLPGA